MEKINHFIDSEKNWTWFGVLGSVDSDEAAIKELRENWQDDDFWIHAICKEDDRYIIYRKERINAKTLNLMK